MSRIILNAIFKNEAARIIRCLRSVGPHITDAVIVDTGSTDDTIALCHATLAEFGVVATVSHAEFKDFSAARNIALERARVFASRYDETCWFLFLDADMTLVAEKSVFANLTAPAYSVEQRSGDTHYSNTRLLRSDVPGEYHSPTHEYLSVEGVEPLTTCHFIDYADGSNRAAKLPRDLILLTDTLGANPLDQRACFYLGQTLAEMGRHEEAAATYTKRVTLGGWQEEVWMAAYKGAQSLLYAGKTAEGVHGLLAAYNMNPSRAEPLFALARHYRERPDQQATALLFAEAGLQIPKPAEGLFLETGVYDWGLREERAICANYSKDPSVWQRGLADCDWLSTSKEVPHGTRWQARRNLYYYSQSLETLFPSVKRTRIDFPCEDGWWAMNASLLPRREGGLWLLQRTCNFKVDKVSGEYSMPQGITRTRNFLCHLDGDLKIVTATELHIDPEPPVNYPWVLGFEDMRLFEDNCADLWISATTRQLDADGGLCEIVMGRIFHDRVVHWEVVSSRADRRNEKNWAPIIGDPFAWLYLHDPFTVKVSISSQSQGVTRHVITPSPLALDHFRGSSQLIPFDNGYLEVEHEVVEGIGPRKYLHRFVYIEDNRVVSFTRPFHMADLGSNGNQFVCGLVYDHGTQELLMTYSLNDEESHIARIFAFEVRSALVAR